MPPEDLELFQQRVQAWTFDARPEGDLQVYLVATAALASVRVDRCARTEFAAIARRRRRAIANWEQKQEEQVNAAAARLETEPAEAVAELKDTAAGCDWLRAQWTQLEKSLGSWTEADHARALRLSGRKPADPAANENRAEGDGPEPTPDPAALVRAGQDGLEAQAQKLWREHDGPALAEAIDLATFDGSRRGALRNRYAAASSLELHRALNQLRAIHREQRICRKDPSDPRHAPPGWSKTDIATCPGQTHGPDSPVTRAMSAFGVPPQPQPQPEPEPQPGPAQGPQPPVTGPEPAPHPAPAAEPAPANATANADASPNPAAAEATPSPLPAGPPQHARLWAALDQIHAAEGSPNPFKATAAPQSAAPQSPSVNPPAAQNPPAPPPQPRAQTPEEWFDEQRRAGRCV